MSDEQIKVYLRLRHQQENDSILLVQDNNKQIILDSKPDQKIFQYDQIFEPQTDQKQIYENVGNPILKNCLDGYDSTIFVYGQTGTGKTFTMSGKNFEFNDQERGLQQRILEQLFQQVQDQTIIKFSYFEIFNEQIFDLLGNDQSCLNIRENIDKGIYIEKLQEFNLQNLQQSINLLKKGQDRKQVASHAMNKQSSRSHTILQLTIEQKSQNTLKISKLNLVDLAGSERQKKALTSGQRLKEASNINKSLSVLGNVINALAEKSVGKQNKFVPYRDSKLTYILKESLGGNSKTSMIATINTNQNEFQEILSTLKFAQRVKSIKLESKLNVQKFETISDLKFEIQQLKDKILKQQSQPLNDSILEQQKYQEISQYKYEIEQYQNELEIQEIKNDYLQQQINEKNNQYQIIQDDYDTLLQSYNYQKFQIDKLQYENKTQQQQILKYQVVQKSQKPSMHKLQLQDIQQLKLKLLNKQDDQMSIMSSESQTIDNNFQKIKNSIKDNKSFKTKSNHIIQDKENYQYNNQIISGKTSIKQDYFKQKMQQKSITNFFGIKKVKI